MPVELLPADPIIEPGPSTKTPPVQSLVVDMGQADYGYGLYVTIQDSQTGQFWNHNAQAFQPYSSDAWDDYAFDLYFRQNALWGRFFGADEFPAGTTLLQTVYAIVTPGDNNENKRYGRDRFTESRFSKPWPSPAPGTVAINHDTGGSDALQFVDQGNNPIIDAVITAYFAADYATNGANAVERGRAETDQFGRWKRPIRLMPNTTYTLSFARSGYQTVTETLTTGGLA